MLLYQTSHMVLGVISFLLSFLTIVSLVVFLSSFNSVQTSVDSSCTRNTSSEFTPSFIKAETQNSDLTILLWDLCLLLLFVLQHSGLKKTGFEEVLRTSGFHHLYRSLYVLTTNLALLVLVGTWETCPTLLWSCPSTSWWMFSLTHYLSWHCLYFATLQLDLPDILGIRQIVEHCSQHQPPIDPSLSRLYTHMRHPSFCCLTLVLVARPYMTLDRAMLASLLCLYMYRSWCPDLRDLQYRERQWEAKKRIFRGGNRK